MHLFQLVGGQVWPNFLPILAFKPTIVTFLTSADPNGKFGESVTHLADACRELGCPFEQEIIKTESEQPSISECARALGGRSADLFNLTGGTKPMSIAAHAHAGATSKPSFYLDTRRKEDHFEFTETGTHTAPYPSLEEISAQITVRIALKAQGFPVPISFKDPNADEIEFATRAAQIRRDGAANDSISGGITGMRSQFIDPKNGRMLGKGKLRAALQRPIQVVPDTPFHEYLATAAKQGVIQQLEPDHEFLLTTLDPTTENADTLRSAADKGFKLLEGIWFELALFEQLKSKPDFSDVCWSVEAVSENSNSIGETDLVAFNSRTLSLHFISCKTTGPHGSSLDHIQGLRRRATKEGGKFSQAELWIFSPKSSSSRASLAEHCKEQGVSLHIFSEEIT
jgi:hypothetical protein